MRLLGVVPPSGQLPKVNGIPTPGNSRQTKVIIKRITEELTVSSEGDGQPATSICTRLHLRKRERERKRKRERERETTT